MQIYQDLILCKSEAHREFPWHQDAPFWPIDFSKAATFWIPLSEVNEFNGGLKFSQDYEAKNHAAVNLHTGVKQDGTPDLNLMKFTRPRCIPETYSSLAQQYFMHRALDSVQKSE